MRKSDKRHAVRMAAVSVAVLLGMEPASASSLYSWGYMGPLMPRDFGVERRRALEFARPQRPVPQRKNLEARTPKNNFKPKNVAVRNLPTKNTTKNTSKSANNSTTTIANKPTAAPEIPGGPRLVVVSIGAQRASFFANGTLVRSAPISTGTASHPTPMGVFSILQKSRHHVSNLYDAKMPFMQRLTWSGTALHQGPLPGYPASHGCVRLPEDFAQMLWGATRIGARVIVTRNEVAPAEIVHPRLIAPMPPAALVEQSPPGTLVKTADATNTITGAVPDAARRASTTGAGQPARVATVDIPPQQKTTARANPVSMFVSRKEGKLFVRQGTEPLFDAPVTIREPGQPLGTHVFTAMKIKDEAMRWTVVSIPSSFPRPPQPSANHESDKKKKHRDDRKIKAAAVDPGPLPSASSALDRIEMPQGAIDRLAGMLTPGSSLIVSDNGISSETGKTTDFIILTP